MAGIFQTMRTIHPQNICILLILPVGAHGGDEVVRRGVAETRPAEVIFVDSANDASSNVELTGDLEKWRSRTQAHQLYGMSRCVRVRCAVSLKQTSTALSFPCDLVFLGYVVPLAYLA
jgi:hypothetical protein